MSRPRRLTLATLFVAAPVLAAGCGGDGGSDTEPDAAVDAPISDTVDETAEDAGPDGADTDVVDEGGADADVEEEVIQTGELGCSSEPIPIAVTPSAGATATLPIDNTSISASVRFLGREVTTATTVTVGCAESLVPEGIIALGPAFSITSDGAPRFERRYFVSTPFDLTKLPPNARPSDIRLYHRRATGEVLEPVTANFQENMVRGTVRFESEITGDFQLGVEPEAGTAYDREWTFRAVTGVSMGGLGSSMIGFRHPDSFDFVGPLGGPAEWVYLAHYIRDGGMGGFAPAPTYGEGVRFTPTQESEHNMAFDEWYFPTGEGTGGSFDRGSYAEIFLDLMMAVGNIVTYSDVSPFLPPGLPFEEATRPASERCPRGNTCPPTDPSSTFTIASGYYDDEFNPTGSMPVIAFCDGEGSRDRSIPFDRACDTDFDGQPDETNEGLYDEPCAQSRPVDITLAVDVNGNGIRDPGEPIIRNFYEPFADVGADGIPSSEEEGYDPVTNPDPAGDDYNYVDNQAGTEGNWLYDVGEPFEDYGLDGVEGTPQLADGGYDYGEGNGVFDYNPNLLRVFEEVSPRQLYAAMTPEQRRNLNVYLDSGIRDLFNFAVGANQLAGTLELFGGNVRVYEDFFRVQDLDPSEANDYNFTAVDWENLGRNVYVRYGNIDADEEDICFGDGKHVGTIPQLANRLLTMLGYITNRFPDGDRNPISSPYPLASGTFFAPSPSIGGVMRYSIAFPPGYEWTACIDGRDNDGDGLRDGEDPDCLSAATLSESGESVTRCTDGIDNDADGRADADDPDCASGDGTSEWPTGSPFRDSTFPVVYILHGYGQTPDELQVAAVPFSTYMASGDWPKAILVFPDGYCGEIEVTACNDGIDNDGDGDIDGGDSGCGTSGGRSETGERVAFCADGVDNDRDGLADGEDGGCLSDTWDSEANCVQGNFYTDHLAYPDGVPGGPAYESAFFDLMEYVDTNYRARAPEVLPYRP
ncbi:MAG: hypothetical protein H6700_08630 [Myxococcales bacterium]|nr:hypothetical protein [Myxococcales bacterium]MCB9520089.1 hypothetical protein [Myxococcales bacterium]MCB9531815.1 hypothetical protein [Myxococcales bacterium]